MVATVAGRAGLCPRYNEVSRPGPQIVVVTVTNTSTAWWIDYKTTVVKNITTIGTISHENCIGTATLTSVIELPTEPVPGDQDQVSLPVEPPTESVVPPPDD